jgi:small subunit ribosomal protein S6
MGLRRASGLYEPLQLTLARSEGLASNVYEGMFILDSNRFGRDPEGVSGQISKAVQQAGGEVLVSRLWEERRLAYSIKGHKKGTYWLAYFRLPAAALAGMRQHFQLSETILRMLFVKVDARLVDALVAHAVAGPTPVAPRREETRPSGGHRDRDVAIEVPNVEEIEAVE